MKKILYITTVGMTMSFFDSLIKKLVEEGHTVDIACNDKEHPVHPCFSEFGCRVYTIDCSRTPFDKGNLRAIKQIERLTEKEHYDIVHCHTPVAAMCARLACIKARKRGTKVIYTAHGFHFYKGAPLKNWLLYYPVEKFCAHFTDVLITINHEDYELAKKKMKAKRVEYVPGVGIDIDKFANCTVDRAAKRKELGIPEDAPLLFSIGELNKNKNHEVVIRAIKDLDVYYVIAGSGELQTYLQKLIDDLGLSDRVKLLGYRDDVAQLYKAADMFVFASIREGLGLAPIEAMASGLPLVVADNRGSREYAVEGKTGFICKCDSVEGFSQAIRDLMNDLNMRKNISMNNKETAKQFDVLTVQKQIMEIYNSD